MKKRSVEDFILGECLGSGSYSRVYRAISKSNRQTYAIKILNKQHIHQERKRKYVTIEKDTLNLLGKHDGIVMLYYTFQDSKRLYFVIDYASNGELLTLIHKYGNLSEKLVRYYSIQLIDTLSFIHSKGVIHRDLKPENILLNSEWKIMITDFGAAKMVGEELEEHEQEQSGDDASRTGSFVGTAEYVTPELLEKNQCGIETDYWALGCIIYQMIIGRPPFKESTEYDTFLKIINLDYKFPLDCPIPMILKDLIINLLKSEPEERLTLEGIQSHKWFKGVQWGDWRSIWGQRVPKFERYDPSPLLILTDSPTNVNMPSLNLKKEINDNDRNKKLMNKVINRGTNSPKKIEPINTSMAQLKINTGTQNKVNSPKTPPITWKSRASPRTSPVVPNSPNFQMPPPRKVSSDAISAAGVIGQMMMNNGKIPPNKNQAMVNPLLLDKEIPKIIKEKLLLNERILKLDNIMKSEIGFKPNQFVKRGEPLTDEILQMIIKNNEFVLNRNLKVCILVITSFARLFIYELVEDSNGPGGPFLTNFMEIKLTNNMISLYDYEFDEDSKDGYLILELNNLNKLIFLSNWDNRNMINKGGLNSNVRVGFKVGDNETWIASLLKAKRMLKKGKYATQ